MTRRCPWKKRSTPPAAAPPPQEETAARRPASSVRGEHEFHIVGYNARAALAKNAHYSILSGAFKVGGHNWALDCSFDDDGHLASIALLLLTAYISDDAVVAKASLRIEDPLGRWPAAVWESDEAYTFHVWSGNSWQLSQAGRSWTLSVPEAFRSHESHYMEDDRLTILCTVEVLREEEEDSGIAEDMQKLLFLSSESKSTRPACMLPNVTFVVEQAEIQAHRLVLAMRSPVFAAELLGDMREGTTRHIMVDDMSASTFRAMLRFIYTDKLNIKRKASDVALRSQRGCKEKRAARRRVDMALDLLVAADRYDLEKLRLMCDKILSENIDVDSVTPTLMVVHGRLSCRQLEASCIDYLASDDDVYANVKAMEEYKELEESCWSFTADVMDKVAKRKLAANDSSLGANTSRRRPEKKSVSTYNISEVVRGTYEMRIPNFDSMRRNYSVKQTIFSDIFQIGGYDWKLKVSVKEKTISVFAKLLTDPGTAGLRAALFMRMHDPGGKLRPILRRFKPIFSRKATTWGYSNFMSAKGTESPYQYLAHDGSLTIRCNFLVSAISASVEDKTLAPPPSIMSHLEELLVSEKASDVKFLVEKREIHAHSLIIATRCPTLYMVVAATNKEEAIIPINDMKAAVFKAMLHFIYTDELPPLEDIALAAGDGTMTTAGDMLAVVCRFQLDRMKDKCETLFGQSVSKQNASSMLKLARHHHCMKLKDYCLKFE
ncbi:BTB/POZ and MATH domain-containing protein 3-like [Triticum dicoccoides]|uniref:BTB/POZ and MATH domain-containing protein 3-like n=1 Tax=Triticum dicoccoides TaxID=85692 RepID=UPI00188DD040|nr:BTB/POZ and MATH domain-containing protein 3-like [Triticum dicoccoides]